MNRHNNIKTRIKQIKFSVKFIVGIYKYKIQIKIEVGQKKIGHFAVRTIKQIQENPASYIWSVAANIA